MAGASCLSVPLGGFELLLAAKVTRLGLVAKSIELN